MLNVQKYLSENSLEKLQEELNISVTDYPDLVVLNYGIKSPRFHPVCDECRALILEKGTWRVLARSFDRFYNYHEGNLFKKFPWDKAGAEEKLDGSLINMWWYRDRWEVATRKMAFAEGPLNIGAGTFRGLWEKAINNTPLASTYEKGGWDKTYTYIFELTAPENRIVTRYMETKVTLIGARSVLGGLELRGDMLDDVLEKEFGVKRPRILPCRGIDDVVARAQALDPLEEGFVVVADTGEPSLKRIKVKNTKYLAIAHVRDNGQVSAKRLLTLVMSGRKDLDEFLSYFNEYKQYTDFLVDIWDKTVSDTRTLWNALRSTTDQKEFALAAQARTKNPLVLSSLFSLKKGRPVDKVLAVDPDRAYKALNIKKRFEQKFKIEEDT